MIREQTKELSSKWQSIFEKLPLESRIGLRQALLELRQDALNKSKYCWDKHKAPMAFYWKVVGVYAGHIARAIKV